MAFIRDQHLRAVIFDCDGVLFDSAPANVAFYNSILDVLGEPPLAPAYEHRVTALSSPQVLAELFRDDPARHAEAVRVAAEVDYRPFFKLMVPAVGLHDVLAQLRTQYRVAMATNRGRTIPDLLKEFDLEGAFDAVVGILDVARPKPYPDMLLECVRRLGFTCAAAVYVGDSNGDRQAAAAAGMRFIAVGDQCQHSARVAHIGELTAVLHPSTP